MNTKEIKDLLKLIADLDLKEVRIKDKEFELRVRTDKDTTAPIISAGAPMVSAAPQAMPISSTPPPAAPVAVAAQGDAAEEISNGYVEIKSPMVGTFYRSSSPDKPPYIKVGDDIAIGDVVCIIEAMKLFNEIESEIAGKIVKVLADDSSPVEYDQPLFLVDPSS